MRSYGACRAGRPPAISAAFGPSHLAHFDQQFDPIEPRVSFSRRCSGARFSPLSEGGQPLAYQGRHGRATICAPSHPTPIGASVPAVGLFVLQNKRKSVMAFLSRNNRFGIFSSIAKPVPGTFGPNARPACTRTKNCSLVFGLSVSAERRLCQRRRYRPSDRVISPERRLCFQRDLLASRDKKL